MTHQHLRSNTRARQKQKRTRTAISHEQLRSSRISSGPNQASINANKRKYNSKRVSNPSLRNSPNLDNLESSTFTDGTLPQTSYFSPPLSDHDGTVNPNINTNVNTITHNFDGVLDSSSIQTPPPLDEYVGSDEEVPPYRENLHKYLDLFSFDPRFAPVLRVNKSLVPDNDILGASIQHFKDFNLLPPDIDLWRIHHIDDLEYNDMLPNIIQSVPVRRNHDTLAEDLRQIEEMEANQRRTQAQVQNEEQNRIPTTELDDLDTQLACIMSLIDIDQERRRNYRGFRYQSPTSSS